jgi:hypothetical protein
LRAVLTASKPRAHLVATLLLLTVIISSANLIT